jgi:hypothetical protein
MNPRSNCFGIPPSLSETTLRCVVRFTIQCRISGTRCGRAPARGRAREVAGQAQDSARKAKSAKEEAVAGLRTQRKCRAGPEAEGVRTPGCVAGSALGRSFPIDHLAAIGFSAALSTLGKIMVDLNVPASTRWRPANSVFDHPKHAIENEDGRPTQSDGRAKGNLFSGCMGRARV